MTQCCLLSSLHSNRSSLRDFLAGRFVGPHYTLVVYVVSLSLVKRGNRNERKKKKNKWGFIYIYVYTELEAVNRHSCLTLIRFFYLFYILNNYFFIFFFMNTHIHIYVNDVFIECFDHIATSWHLVYMYNFTDVQISLSVFVCVCVCVSEVIYIILFRIWNQIKINLNLLDIFSSDPIYSNVYLFCRKIYF